MKFAKKIIFAIMTGILLTTSAIPCFAQQSSTSSVTSDLPEKETRATFGTLATKTATVSPKLYWQNRTGTSYEVGTVDIKVTYGYNSITKTGTVKAVEVIQYNTNEDFEAYRRSGSSTSIIILVKNLEPGPGKYQNDKGKNTFEFFVKADGSVSYTDTVSFFK